MRRLPCLALVFAAMPAAAQQVSVSGDIALHSELMDRGLSLSEGDPSGSGAIYLDHDSGLYAGLFLARTDDPVGNDLELEGVLGYGQDIGAYRLDLSAAFDSFHGEDSFAYPEMAAKISRDFGLFYAAAGISYAPDGRWFIRNEDTVYTYLEAEVPVPHLPWLAFTSHAGYETVTDATDKADWGLGLAAGYRSLEFTVGYEDSDSGAEIGEARAVAAIRFYF